jgi:hypothetical protein
MQPAIQRYVSLWSNSVVPNLLDAQYFAAYNKSDIKLKLKVFQNISNSRRSVFIHFYSLNLQRDIYVIWHIPVLEQSQM